MADFKEYILKIKLNQAGPNWHDHPIQVDTSSEIMYSLMEETILQLKSELYGHDIPTYQFFRPFLTKIDTHAGEFFLVDQPKITKISSNNYSCEMFFKKEEYKLAFYKFKDLDGNLTFSLTMRAVEFLQLIINAMNAKGGNWNHYIEYIDDDKEKTISFDGNNLREALKMICEAFNTEFEIIYTKDSKGLPMQVIRVHKVEYFKDEPFKAHYGEEFGLLPGITVNSAKTQMVEILYARGGERNINPSTNNNIKYLLLPKSKTIYYNGEDFLYPGYLNNPLIFPEPIPDGFRVYVTDTKGFYIKRGDLKILSGYEDIYISDNIYPHRIGKVTNVIPQNIQNNIYYFEDNTIPSSLDYSKLRIVGEKMTVKFESGNLAGLEFELPQSSTTVTGYIHSSRQFRPDPLNKDGQTYPNQLASINLNDEYAVFGMNMPQAYISDDNTHSGASWDLYRDAVKYLYDKENGEVLVQFKIDPIYASNPTKWNDINPYLRIGAYYLLKDKEIVGEELKVRVLGMKQNLFYKEKVDLTLSNTYLRKNFRTEIDGRFNNIIITEKETKDRLDDLDAAFSNFKGDNEEEKETFFIAYEKRGVDGTLFYNYFLDKNGNETNIIENDWIFLNIIKTPENEHIILTNAIKDEIDSVVFMYKISTTWIEIDIASNRTKISGFQEMSIYTCKIKVKFKSGKIMYSKEFILYT